jgi:hypothetical protein
MDMFRRSGLAVVIELQKDLADTVCDLLTLMGYRAFSERTHAAAAAFVLGKNVALLAACVPAIDEDRAGIYLKEAVRKSPQMSVVLMLIDKLQTCDDAPRQAVKLVKPFDRDMLTAAIIVSEAMTRIY